MNIFQVIDNYQYEMESRYQEKSMFTNLFTEHKFIGWLGLFIIFLSIFAIFFFQAEDGIRDQPRSRGLGDVYKRQLLLHPRPIFYQFFQV